MSDRYIPLSHHAHTSSAMVSHSVTNEGGAPSWPVVVASVLVGAYLCQQFVSEPTPAENPAVEMEETREDFTTMPSFQTQVQKIYSQGGNLVGVPNNNQNELCNRPNVDFIQVPGTYQTMPPPRMSSVSIGAAVNWNPPRSNHMSVDVKSPLPWAQTVERVKEGFDYPKGPSAQYQDMTQNLAKEGALQSRDTLQTPALPQPASMTTMSVNTDSKEPSISYDRLIYANRPRLLQGSDYIRGDLPICPILPSLNPNSCVWMRPSGDTNGLNSGALGVISGAYNSDMRDLVQLKMTNTGGVANAQAGTTWTIPSSTAVGQKLYNLATTDSTMGDGGPFGDVTNRRQGLVTDLSNYQGQRVPW